MSDKNVKGKFVSFRLDGDDLSRLHKVSSRESIPMATLIRKVVREQLLYPQAKTPSEGLENFTRQGSDSYSNSQWEAVNS